MLLIVASWLSQLVTCLAMSDYNIRYVYEMKVWRSGKSHLSAFLLNTYISFFFFISLKILFYFFFLCQINFIHLFNSRMFPHKIGKIQGGGKKKEGKTHKQVSCTSCAFKLSGYIETFRQMKAGWSHPQNCGHIQTVNQPLLVVIQDSN